MRHRPLRTLLFLVAALPLHAAAQRVTATHLGNSAFRIGLGGWTLFIDFPYRPDCPGCDRYTPPPDLGEVDGTALITRAGPEHFDSVRFRATRLDLLAPFVPAGEQAAALSRLEAQGIYAYPQAAADGDKAGASYIVSYRGRRLCFTGDAQDPAPLLAARDLAAAFVSEALLRTVHAQGKRIDTRVLVVTRREATPADSLDLPTPCDACRLVVPHQGEVIELFR